MNREQRDEVIQSSKAVARICANGFRRHAAEHGPDGNIVAEDQCGSPLVTETMIGGAMSFVRRNGDWFAVCVVPMQVPPAFPGAEKTGPVLSYEPGPEASR